MTNTPCQVTLVDAVADREETILATAYVSPINGELKPAYIHFGGNLVLGDAQDTVIDQVADTDAFDTTNNIIYSSFYKQHFQSITSDVGSEFVSHKLILRVSAGNYVSADINVIVSDNLENTILRKGIAYVRESDKVKVEFDDGFVDGSYSISFTCDQIMKGWYSDKRNNSFILNFEREFSGKIYWTAVYNTVKN